MTRIDLPNPRVVGIDPSLTATGIADETGAHTIASGPGTPSLRVRHRRLALIVHDINTRVLGVALGQPRAALVTIEAPSLGQARQGGTLDRHGLWWLTVDRLTYHDLPVAEVPPATLKKFATGKGNATKADMRMALYQRTGADVRDDNQVDAIWLRHLGLHLIGAPEIDLPKTHLAALAKVRDPREAP